VHSPLAPSHLQIFSFLIFYTSLCQPNPTLCSTHQIPLKTFKYTSKYKIYTTWSWWLQL
jgi:hypothetical protein